MFSIFLYSFRLKKSNFYPNNCDYFSMATGTDVQFLPANNVVQPDQRKRDVVTHQPPPSYGQINTQTMQNLHHNPGVPAYFYQNGQMVPMQYVNSGMNGPYGVVSNTAKGCDYCNIVWSSCNILCCFCLLGIIALGISIVTLRLRTSGDHQGAQCATIWATIINALATIVGIIAIILIGLNYTGQITL